MKCCQPAQQPHSMQCINVIVYFSFVANSLVFFWIGRVFPGIVHILVRTVLLDYRNSAHPDRICVNKSLSILEKYLCNSHSAFYLLVIAFLSFYFNY